ncbi:hypothetical protein IPA_02945 [Ignicoccus pacificus DSM 13166]|uniref:Uncharacterized protein n=1 Tax=Ignicoccus pacificus DSM 13166 TaxID=940294 RepID=A0A977KAV8_9CREN|nr:hypothetical protein IPA_02945 [Ignicoccus pacificus DSM 13166]
MVIGAFIMMILLFLAIMMVVNLINRQQEVRMEGIQANSQASAALQASLLASGLCACTSQDVQVPALPSASLLSLIYKGGVKLPDTIMVAITLTLNVTFESGAKTITQVVLTPTSTFSQLALIDPITGKSAVAGFKLLLPTTERSPPFQTLLEGAEKEGWEVAVNNNTNTGMYAIALIQFALQQSTPVVKRIKVIDVKVSTPDSTVSLAPCRLTIANSTGTLSAQNLILQGTQSTSKCNCTCKVSGLSVTQWISFAASFLSGNAPPPPDGRTAVFFIPFEVLSQTTRKDFPVVIPVNATELALEDAADGKSFPINYLKEVYANDPNLQKRIEFFKETCGPGGFRCAYIYGIMAWVENPETGQKTLVKWSFTPAISPLTQLDQSLVPYPTASGTIYSNVSSLTFRNPLGYSIVLQDKDNNMVPEVYICYGSDCNKLSNAPFSLSDHWGLFVPSVILNMTYLLYTNTGTLEPYSPTYFPASLPYANSTTSFKPGDTVALIGASYGGDSTNITADHVIKYMDPALSGSNAYGVIKIPFNALINGTVFLKLNVYGTGVKVFLDSNPVYTNWNEESNVTELVKSWYISVTSPSVLQDQIIRIKLPPELIGKPISIYTENGTKIPFCYEEANVVGQLGVYGACSSSPSSNDVAIWIKTNLTSGSNKFLVKVGTNGASEPGEVFYYYDSFMNDMGWRTLEPPLTALGYDYGTVIVPSFTTSLYGRSAVEKTVIPGSLPLGANDPAGGYLEIPADQADSGYVIVNVTNAGTVDYSDGVAIRIKTPFVGKPLYVSSPNYTSVSFCYETLSGACTTDYTRSDGYIWVRLYLAPKQSIILNISVSNTSNVADPSDVFYMYTDFSQSLGNWEWLFLRGNETLTAPPNYDVDGALLAWGNWNDWWNVSWNPFKYSYEAALAYSNPIPTSFISSHPIVIEGLAWGNGTSRSGDHDLGLILTNVTYLDNTTLPDIYKSYVGLALVSDVGTEQPVWVLKYGIGNGTLSTKYGVSERINPLYPRYFKVIFNGTAIKFYEDYSYSSLLESPHFDYSVPASLALPKFGSYVTLILHGDTDSGATKVGIKWIRIRVYAPTVHLHYIKWPSKILTLGNGLVLEYFSIMPNSPNVVSVGLGNETHEFDAVLNLTGSGSISILRRSFMPSFTSSTIVEGPMQVMIGEWYYNKFTITPMSLQYFVDGPTTAKLGAQLSISPNSVFDKIVVRGDYPYWIDELRIRPLIPFGVEGRFGYELVKTSKTLPIEYSKEIAINVRQGHHVLTIYFHDNIDTGYLIFKFGDGGDGVLSKPLLSSYGYGNAAGWVTVDVPFEVQPGEMIKGGVAIYVKYWPLEMWNELGGVLNGNAPVEVKVPSNYIAPPQGNYTIYYAPLERGCYNATVQDQASCPLTSVNLHGEQPATLLNIPLSENFQEYGNNTLSRGMYNAQAMILSGKWGVLPKSNIYVEDLDSYLKSKDYPILGNDTGDMELMITKGGVYLSEDVMEKLRPQLMDRWVICYDVMLATNGNYSGTSVYRGPGEGMVMSFYKSFNYLPGAGPIMGFFGTGDSSGFGLEIDTKYTPLAQFDGTNDFYLDNEPPAPHFALLYRNMFTNWLPGEVIASNVTNYSYLLNRWHRICVVVEPKEPKLVKGSYYAQEINITAYETDNVTGRIKGIVLQKDFTGQTYSGGEAIGSDILEYFPNGTAVTWSVIVFKSNSSLPALTPVTLSPTVSNGTTSFTLPFSSTLSPVPLSLGNLVRNSTKVSVISSYPITTTPKFSSALSLTTAPNVGVTVFNGPNRSWLFSPSVETTNSYTEYYCYYVHVHNCTCHKRPQYYCEKQKIVQNLQLLPPVYASSNNVIWTGLDTGSSNSTVGLITGTFGVSGQGTIFLQVSGGNSIVVWYQYKPVGGTWGKPVVLLNASVVAKNVPNYLIPLNVKPGKYRIIVLWADTGYPDYVSVDVYNGKGMIPWIVRMFIDKNIKTCDFSVSPLLTPSPANWTLPNVKPGDDVVEMLRPPMENISNYFNNGATWYYTNVYEIANEPSLAVWNITVGNNTFPQIITSLAFNEFVPFINGSLVLNTPQGTVYANGQILEYLYSYPQGIVLPLGSAWFLGSEEAVLPQGIPNPYSYVYYNATVKQFIKAGPYFGLIPTDASYYLLYDSPANAQYYLNYGYDIYVNTLTRIPYSYPLLLGNYSYNGVNYAVGIWQFPLLSGSSFPPPIDLDSATGNTYPVFSVAYSIIKINKPTVLSFTISATNAQEVVVARVYYNETDGTWRFAEKPRVVESGWTYASHQTKRFNVSFDEPGYYIIIIYFENSCKGGGLYVKVNEVNVGSSAGIYIPPSWSIGFTASGNLGPNNVTTLIDNVRICKASPDISTQRLVQMCASANYTDYAKENKIKVLFDDDFNYINNFEVVKNYEPGPEEKTVPSIGIGVIQNVTTGNVYLRLVPDDYDRATVLLIAPKKMNIIRWLTNNKPWAINFKVKVKGTPEGFAFFFYKRFYPMAPNNLSSVWEVRPMGGSALGLLAGPKAGYSPGYAVEFDYVLNNVSSIPGLTLEKGLQVNTGSHVALVKDSPYNHIGYHGVPLANILNDGKWHSVTIYVDPTWAGNCYYDRSPSLTDFSFKTSTATCGGKVLVFIDGKLVLNTTAGSAGFSIPRYWFMGFSATTGSNVAGAVYIDNITLIVPKTSIKDPQKLIALANNSWVKTNGMYLEYVASKDPYDVPPWEREAPTSVNYQLWGVSENGTYIPPGTVGALTTLSYSSLSGASVNNSWPWVTLSILPSNASLQLPSFELYGINYTNVSITPGIGSLVFSNGGANATIAIAESPFDMSRNTTAQYYGWEGAHLATWAQYGYSHGQKWSAIWWDEEGHPNTTYSPWMRGRFGVILYESGDFLLQYDRTDFLFPGANLTDAVGLDSMTIGFKGSTSSGSRASFVILSTAKGTDRGYQQVGLFSDVWSGMDLFNRPKIPKAPDTNLVWQKLPIGNLTVSRNGDYMSVALTTSWDILAQYQGNLYMLIGGAQCINCNSPSVQIAPSPTNSQNSGNCFCSCAQNPLIGEANNVNTINISLTSLTCKMVLYQG